MRGNKNKSTPVDGSQTLNNELKFILVTIDCYPCKGL